MSDSQRGFELLQAGDADGLRRILEPDPAASEACDATGVSLLMHSLYRGRRDLAELIASKKKALDIFEATSLGHLDRLRQCLRDASAINSRSKDGFTALHFACFFSQPEAARLLLESGAPVNARQQGGWVPIHAAAQNGDRPMVELLLKHHADPKLANDEGKTPAMVASEKGHEEIAALLV
jgi:ankyrin repeat protein